MLKDQTGVSAYFISLINYSVIYITADTFTNHTFDFYDQSDGFTSTVKINLQRLETCLRWKKNSVSIE